MVKKPKKNKDIFEKEAKLRLKERKFRHKKARKPYQKKRVIVPVILVSILFLIGVHSFLYSLKFQSTDDAFVEGRLVSVAPRIFGQVVKLYVNDNDYVKKGQLLLEIDPNDFKNKLSELQAALVEANANMAFASADFARYKKLLAEGLCTKQEYENAKTKAEATKAAADKLFAQVKQAKLDLSYTKIYAPQDGNISARNVEEGNYVQVGQSLLAVVSPEVWIVANFKETQLGKMKKGQEVTVKIDTYPRKKFKAKVDSIQKSSGAKTSLFPPENAVGSYVKVVQRIPVKIVFEEDISNYNIAPGMSVIPKVKIKP